MVPLAGGSLARRVPPKTAVGGYLLFFLRLFTFSFKDLQLHAPAALYCTRYLGVRKVEAQKN
jgi:hypothetical protein